MPIDIEVIRMLPVQEVNKIVTDLNVRLEESQRELHIIESKLKKAVQEDSSRPSDIGILISYRDEIRQVVYQIKADLKMIDMFQGGCDSDPGTSTAESISGAGAVYFRNVNENTRKIAGVKNYAKILEEREREEEMMEIIELSEKMKKAQEFLKMEESKKSPQAQKQQSQTSKI